MQQSDLPTRFPIPFANNAGAGYVRTIPQAHQSPSSGDAPASLYDGFPPETFIPLASGGIPPNGKDFNGILKQITQWAQWQAAGGPAFYNSTFSSAINGYPKGARLNSASFPGVTWESTVENNTTDPDGGSAANWVPVTYWEQSGTVPGPLYGNNNYTLTFPVTFPNALVSYGLTAVNETGSTVRDSWVQRISKSKSGIVFAVQWSGQATDISIDGVDWWARGY